MNFRVIDGCPCPAGVAPHVARLLKRAGLTATSIYRGHDAAPILHRHHKHSQLELWRATPAQRRALGVTGTPNQPGRSMHELRSDGVAKRGPVGRKLQEWEVGIDAGPNTGVNRALLRRAARELGYVIYFPYDSRVEYHHFGFAKKPRARNPVQLRNLIRERAALPRT